MMDSTEKSGFFLICSTGSRKIAAAEKAINTFKSKDAMPRYQKFKNKLVGLPCQLGHPVQAVDLQSMCMTEGRGTGWPRSFQWFKLGSGT